MVAPKRIRRVVDMKAHHVQFGTACRELELDRLPAADDRCCDGTIVVIEQSTLQVEWLRRVERMTGFELDGDTVLDLFDCGDVRSRIVAHPAKMIRARALRRVPVGPEQHVARSRDDVHGAAFVCRADKCLSTQPRPG